MTSIANDGVHTTKQAAIDEVESEGEKEEHREPQATTKRASHKNDQGKRRRKKKETVNGWENKEFSKLMEDPRCRQELEGECRSLCSQFTLPNYYSFEDFFVDALIHLAENFHKFRGESSLRTFFHTMCRRLLIDLFRKRKFEMAAVTSLEELLREREDKRKGSEPESHVAALCDDGWKIVEETLDGQNLVRKLMRLLNQEERFILLSYEVERKTLEEIGDELGEISPQAVSKRLLRILKKLRSSVESLEKPARRKKAGVKVQRRPLARKARTAQKGRRSRKPAEATR